MVIKYKVNFKGEIISKEIVNDKLPNLKELVNYYIERAKKGE